MATNFGNLGTGSAAAMMAKRMQAAKRTPSGGAQPPEVRNVDASAAVPNGDQPEAGEFAAGREVGDGRPAFFPAGMPQPTGLANVGQQPLGHVFGQPVGMLTPAQITGQLAALPALDRVPPPNPLAAMPPGRGQTPLRQRATAYALAALPPGTR